MKLFRRFSPVDLLNFTFWLIMAIFYLVVFQQSAYKLHTFVLLASLAFATWLVIGLRQKAKLSPILKWLSIFYPLLFLVTIFDSLYMILPYINPNIYDQALADLDVTILGVNPTVWIEQIVNPYLTEILYYLYLFYFPMPIFILRYLYRHKKYVELDKAVAFYFMVYYGSYLLYFVVPALGPRFYEPIAALQQKSLDGLFLTDVIRDTINSLEHNKFDAFPSLHTGISLTTLIIIAQHRKKWLSVYIPIIIGIFVSLIYCRYHYFVDIVAAIVWTLISYWLVEKWYKSKLNTYFVPYYSEKESS